MLNYILPPYVGTIDKADRQTVKKPLRNHKKLVLNPYVKAIKKTRL